MSLGRTNSTGIYTADATASAADILSAKTAYVDGVKVTGTIATKTSADLTNSNNTVTVPAGYYSTAATKTVGTAKAAATIYPSTATQYVNKNLYLTGSQTIGRVVVSDTTSSTSILAENIKTGVTVKVGGTNNTSSILQVAGTFTADADAVAANIYSGKTAYVNGAKVTGTMATKAAASYYPSITNQTITSTKCITGTQTFHSVKLTNLVASYIKSGITVQVGDSVSTSRVSKVTGTFTGNFAVCYPYNGTWICASNAQSYYSYMSIVLGDFNTISQYNRIMIVPTNPLGYNNYGYDIGICGYAALSSSSGRGAGVYYEHISKLPMSVGLYYAWSNSSKMLYISAGAEILGHPIAILWKE